MSLEWIFVEIFVNTVEVAAIFYLLCNKFKAKYNNFIPTLLFIAVNVLLISLPVFIDLKNIPIAEICVPLLCFAYLLLFRNGTILKKFFWIFTSFAILYSIAFFSITIIAFTRSVNSVEIITQSSVERLLGMVIAKSLQIVIFYVLAKKKKEFESKNLLSPIPMVFCLIIPFISFILLFFIYDLVNNNYDIPDKYIMLISIGYLTINIIVFVLYEFINREAEKNYLLVAKQKQYELTEQHNSQVIEIYDKIREWRHDYANHMQLIVGILETDASGSKSEAIKYIKNLDEKIESTYLVIVTGNYIIDSIVSAKATLASAHNIKFEHNISLKCDIFIENTDLCSILSNLLDNAIESCCKLEHDRYIDLEILIFKNQFNIKVTNATNGEYNLENGKLKTTKSGDLHGIGMEHVRLIVENYGGIFDIKPESKSFTTHISIPLIRKSSK